MPAPFCEVALGDRKHDDPGAAFLEGGPGALEDLDVIAEIMEEKTGGEPSDGATCDEDSGCDAGQRGFRLGIAGWSR